MGTIQTVELKHCSVCGQFFRPSPRQGEKQVSCSKPECRRERKRRSQKAWSLKNPSYFMGRYDNTKAWRAENPAYQRQRRQKRREIQDTIGRRRKRVNLTPMLDAPFVAPTGETRRLPIAEISQGYAHLRVADPKMEMALLKSLSHLGQISPVVVGPPSRDGHLLLDGFKRLRILKRQGRTEILAREVPAHKSSAQKSLMFTLHGQIHGLSELGNTVRRVLRAHQQRRGDAQEPGSPKPASDACEVALRVGTVDGFVEWETNRYSIPYDQVGSILTVKAAEKEIHIYGGDLVPLGTHERLQRGSCQTVVLPKHHAVKSDRYGLEPVKESFLGLGPSASAFLEGLLLKNRHHGGYHARTILAMKETYHCDDIHKALLHASIYGAYESKAVERFLSAKAKPRTLESLRDEAALRRLQETLPEIKQRPLEEYSLAFLTKQNGEDEDEDEDEKDGPSPRD